MAIELKLTIPLSEEEAEKQAQIIKALADPTRLRILSLLSKHEGLVCVEEIAEALDALQPRMSHHLRILMDAGLLTCQKKKLHAYYHVNRARLAELWLELAALVREVEA